MISQWACIRKNIGTWHGSFTQFSPAGEQVKETPSVLTLEESELGEKMQITLVRSPQNESTSTITQSFIYPGPAPYVYFFETGAFAQGSSQWSAFGQFGAEMSLKVQDQRVRFVAMYEGTSSGTSQIKYVTLIRETKGKKTPFTEPSLTPEQLLGRWVGKVSALSATIQPMTSGTSDCRFDYSQGWLSHERLDSTDPATEKTLEKTPEKTLSLAVESPLEAASTSAPMILQGALTYQLMPLPNGAYCLLPKIIFKGTAFRIEVGWLQATGRSRLIRYYDSRGVWMQSALIEDSIKDSIKK